MGSTMEWAARAGHLKGIPRKVVIMAVGGFAKLFTSLLNSTLVHNSHTLLHLVRHRPPHIPLLTLSNHMSTLDDPLLWGFKGFPITDARLERWVLAAEDICFKNAFLTYFFRLGKCIPITRGGGIYQEHMNEALDRLSEGGWLHTFPEGKVSQEYGPIRRLKWGTASLISRAPISPIVLPIVHCGFEKVMPEKSFFGRRPMVPLCKKDIKIVIGEPIEFDLPRLRQTAISMSRESSFPRLGWPNCSHGLDEAAQQWLYANISDHIWNAMENLRCFASNLTSSKIRLNKPNKTLDSKESINRSATILKTQPLTRWSPLVANLHCTIQEEIFTSWQAHLPSLQSLPHVISVLQVISSSFQSLTHPIFVPPFSSASSVALPVSTVIFSKKKKEKKKMKYSSAWGGSMIVIVVMVMMATTVDIALGAHDHGSPAPSSELSPSPSPSADLRARRGGTIVPGTTRYTTSRNSSPSSMVPPMTIFLFRSLFNFFFPI